MTGFAKVRDAVVVGVEIVMVGDAVAVAIEAADRLVADAIGAAVGAGGADAVSAIVRVPPVGDAVVVVVGIRIDAEAVLRSVGDAVVVVVQIGRVEQTVPVGVGVRAVEEGRVRNRQCQGASARRMAAWST